MTSSLHRSVSPGHPIVRPSSPNSVDPQKSQILGLDVDDTKRVTTTTGSGSRRHSLTMATVDETAIHEQTQRNIFSSSNNKVRLCVGGKTFITTLATLTRDRTSMFAVLFGGRFAEETDADGAYFIDRDPAHFGQILNYLRDGTIALKGMTTNQKQALLREAKYYSVSGLVGLLTTDARTAKAASRKALSQEKEYKLLSLANDRDLPSTFTKMAMMEGYDFESWIASQTVKGGIHVLFSKKLSKGELMLLDRLNTE